MSTILIADDSPVMRRNIRAILAEAGYDVAAEAANGEEAVLAYRRHKPALVTMDITMPVMDGIQAVKTILRDDPDARIIVISAFDRRSMLFEAMENGAKLYLVKPITAEKLLAAVRKVLSPPEADAAPAADDAGTPNGGGPPFGVENRDGSFVIRFADTRRTDAIPQLQMAVQGLLFVKPLRLVFDFGDAAELPPPLLAAVEDLLGRIREAGGDGLLAARTPGLADTLRRAAAPLTDI